MKLSKTQVEHVANLAKLSLTPAEVKKFQQQLSQILDYVEILNQVETTGVESTSQVTGLENVFREDESGPCLSKEEALSGAKSKEKDMFKVKAILANKSDET